MIILIAGASHTGKTRLAQKLLEKYNVSYLSIDHLKMGLIRSKCTDLTPYDDDLLTPYLWNIIKEIIKTAVENEQNLIIEGCYIPFDWQSDFSNDYLKEIKYYCLIIENRGSDTDLKQSEILSDNLHNLKMCKKYGCRYILIDESYDVDIHFEGSDLFDH